MLEQRVEPAPIRNEARGRFFNVVDLVNRPETETRDGKRGRMADYLPRRGFVILDELGYRVSFACRLTGWKKRLELARDAVPGLIVANWVEGRCS